MAEFKEYRKAKKYWHDLVMSIPQEKFADFFRLAASGGSSAQIFDHLQEAGFNFSELELWQVDERHVPPDHSDSNYKLLHEKGGETVHEFHAFDTSLSPKKSAEKFANTLKPDEEGILFDLTILGVGPDGHTASIFPGTGKLSGLTAHTNTDEFAIRDRLTLTLEAIKKSRRIIVIMIGAGKADIWQKIQQAEGLPIHEIKNLPQAEFWWLNE